METLIKKRGSVTILVMLFFVTLVSMIMVFVAAAKDNGVKSTARELGLVWTGSILAEYDLNLQHRYNIFGFYGMEGDIARKLDFYGRQSYDGKKYIKYEGSSAELYEYSLASTKAMKKQIVAVGRLAAAEKLIRPNSKIKASSEEPPGKIGNKAVLNELPSKGSPRSIYIRGVADSLKDAGSAGALVHKGTDGFFENRYIFTYFKDSSDARGLGRTFFQNEVEYIICGKHSDAQNQDGIRRRIIGIREIINLAFVMKDPKMNGETLAAAEIITPGPAAVLTQKAIQAAWALAESYNDYQLLINGKKVPVVKDEHSWAIDMESIVGAKPKKDEDPEFHSEAPYVDPGNTRGADYEDYLSIMTYSMDENVRLLRIMDLIQINMKYGYYSVFRIRDYNGGLKAGFKINGETYEIEKEYQPE